MASINEDRGRAVLEGVLTLEFNVRVHKKYGVFKPGITNLEIGRRSRVQLSDILKHLDTQLRRTDGATKLFLLKAICNGSHQQSRTRNRSRGRQRWKPVGIIPLVCDEIWSAILMEYTHERLEILIDQFVPHIQTPTTGCMHRFLKKELKYLDIVSFVPSKNLRAGHIMNLCRDIFERGVRIKQDLRRGVWMHLVGVFHPGLKSREERERYIDKLRMVYDHLKGKLMGEEEHYYERRQLTDAVHRDAVRTDPENPFFANYRRPEDSYISQHYHRTDDEEENNIQKLINIIVIYTLEHGNISYTQGMTDILSPILYVMKHEADAYICFAAMVERIQLHFQEWCAGTLFKLERLRHLCRVLDPELYRYLTESIEEDAFVLFFGMVLIECRREFSFEDSFHLLETIWAGSTCIKNNLQSTSNISSPCWARYMTYESPEVLQQVFESSGVPYTAVPLPYTMSGSYSIGPGPYQYSRNPSLLSQSPLTMRRQSEVVEPYNVIAEDSRSSSASLAQTPISINRSNGSLHLRRSDNRTDDDATLRQTETSESRTRSQSDPMIQVITSQNDKHTIRSANSSHIASPLPPINATLGGGNSKLGNSSFSHSESELYDSFSNSKIMARTITRNPTEMSDMSSVSSSNVSAAGNLISSLKSIDSHKSATRNCSSERKTTSGEPRRSTSSDGSAYPVDVCTGNSSSGNSDNSSDLGKKVTPHCDTFEQGPPTGDVSTGGDAYTGTSKSHPWVNADDMVSKTVENNISAGTKICPKTGAIHSTVIGSDHSTATGGHNSTATGGHNSTATGGHNSTATGDHNSTATGGHNSSTATGGHNSTATGDHNSTATGGHNSTATGNTVTAAKVPLEDLDSLMGVVQPSEVVEHGGRITNLVPYRDADDVSIRRKHHTPGSHYPHSDGDVIQHRKLFSSPKRIRGRDSPTHRSNGTTPPANYDDEIPSSHRVTPVAFFDAMEKLAGSAPTGGATFSSLFTPRKVPPSERIGRGGKQKEDDSEEEEALPTYRQNRQRTSSDAEISLLVSQLISTDEGAPRVTREESLTIPFSDCYSLFICLSILVQSRKEIMQNGGDFYHLSTVLNSQTGVQDLDATLKVAHGLYRTYRQYQEMCFRGSGRDLNTWLDDTGARV